MSQIVFLLEEQSAAEMLKGLLPKLMPAELANGCRFIPFEGKRDMEKQLARRIRGYRDHSAKFVVMRDQDAGDCHVIKSSLKELCEQASRGNILIRILCRELESWYLADLAAVETALDVTGISKLQNKTKYRNPDSLHRPSVELDKLTKGKYQKVQGSRLIGPLLDPANTRSRSFLVFVAGIRQLVAQF